MEKETGLVHIYHGDGKGKTTAAVGLTLRALGNGLQVVFLQFLKDGSSGEVSLLRHIAQVPDYSLTVMDAATEGFTFSLSAEQKALLLARQNAMLVAAARLCRKGQCDVLVLDEVLHAVNQGLLDRVLLLDLLEMRPAGIEVVLTGRDPSKELLEKADYVTEMRKIKHPYDRGVAARRGVEK